MHAVLEIADDEADGVGLVERGDDEAHAVGLEVERAAEEVRQVQVLDRVHVQILSAQNERQYDCAAAGRVVDDIGQFEPPGARGARRLARVPEDVRGEEVRAAPGVRAHDAVRFLHEPGDPSVPHQDRVVLPDGLGIVGRVESADRRVRLADARQLRVVALEIELVSQQQDEGPVDVPLGDGEERTESLVDARILDVAELEAERAAVAVGAADRVREVADDQMDATDAERVAEELQVPGEQRPAAGLEHHLGNLRAAGVDARSLPGSRHDGEARRHVASCLTRVCAVKRVEIGLTLSGSLP